MEEPPEDHASPSEPAPERIGAGWEAVASGWAAAPPAGGPGIPVPPLPWDPHYQWAPGQQPSPRNYQRRETLIAASAAGVLLIAIIAFFWVGAVHRSAAPLPAVSMPAVSMPALSAPATSTPAASTPAASQLSWGQLQPGDCLAGSNMGLGTGTPWPDLVTQVACTQQHEAEVFYAGSIYPNTPAYPGKKAVDNQADARCAAAFAAYDGTDESDSSFSFADIVDDASADWSSSGNYVACVAYLPFSTGPSGATPVNYSIKGSKQ